MLSPRPLPVTLTGLLLSVLTLPLMANDRPPVRCGFLDPDQRVRVQKLAEGIQAERPRPDLPEFADSPDGHFRVHFTRTGSNAVPPADANGNGLPDFVESAIEALVDSWATQQRYQAMPTPPSDGMEGGSPALDVYLIDLSKAGSAGTGYYGLTIPDSLITDTPEDPWPRFTSWIEMDNDFAPTDTNVFGDTVFATFGVDGLRVTCAHELHHVTQLSLIGDAGVQLMLYELMSTFMEIACYPDLNDWAVYASKFFRTPAGFAFGDPNSLNGYVWGWFPDAFVNRSDALYGNIFYQMRRGSRPFTALVEACERMARPLDTIFVRTLPSMYHTGSRGAENSVLLRAEDLPEIAWHVNEIAQAPSALTSGSLRPFEVRAFRYAIPSLTSTSPVTASILITWPDVDAFQNTQTPSRQDYTVTVTSSPSGTDIPIAGTSWGVRVEPPAIAAWIDQAATRRPSSPYPQPVVLSESDQVSVPVLDALPGDAATVTLMNVQSVGLHQAQGTVTLDEDRIIVPFNMPQNLTPGTYLLQVECNERTDLHKVMVRR